MTANPAQRLQHRVPRIGWVASARLLPILFALLA